MQLMLQLITKKEAQSYSLLKNSNLLFHPYYPYHNYLDEVLQVYNKLMMKEMFQDL
jgi:hypothetical protein